MAVTLNKANLVLKDANGNIGKIEQLSNRDLTKIRTAVSDVALVVNQSNHTPIKATANNLGVVKPDNDTITIDSNGVLTATAKMPSVATTSSVGVVKPDGRTITITADGTLTCSGKNFVTSVNGNKADNEGNVNVARPVVDYLSGIDIAYRHAGSGAFPKVTIPQDGLMVLYAHSENPLTEEAYVELTVRDGDTIFISQAAKPPIVASDYNIFASITLPVIKGQQVECAVLGHSQRICRLFPYIMG